MITDPARLAALNLFSIKPPPDDDTDFQLTVTATTTETANGDQASVQQTFDVTVDAVADTPTVAVQDIATPLDTEIDLTGLSASLTDTDGSETLSVIISGITTGVRIFDDQGTELIPFDDEVTITDPARLAALDQFSILPPSGDSADITLTVRETINTTVVNRFVDGNATIFIEVGVNISGATVGTIALSSLSGADGFVLNGIDAADYSGKRVSAAGDFNGDGFDDFLISADYANSSAGESYVVFGGSDLGSAASVDLSDLDGTNGFIVNGIDADDQSGSSLGAAGDVNGDGIDDIIVGAPFSDPGGVSSAGESYVLFGATGGFSASFDLSDLDGSNGFVINGVAADDFSGSAVNGAGDINGDGIDDIIVGATGADLYAVNERGKSYVIFGDVSIGATGTVELSSLNGTNGVVINGDSAGDYSGYSVSAAGDINGDGIDDFVIGAPLAEPGSPPQPAGGESYVIFRRFEHWRE